MQQILKVIIVLLALIGAVYYWIVSGNEFEVPSPGIYVGTIDGLFPNPVAILISRRSETSPLQIIVAKKGVDPVNVQPSSISGPLKIPSDDGILELVSTVRGEHINGKAYFEGRSAGSFSLIKQPLEAIPLDGVVLADTKIWLTSSIELETIESSVVSRKQRKLNATKEIERLGGFLNDGDLLRGNAQRRLQQEKSSLEKLKSDVETKQQEAKKLSRQVDLAYRVTGMGRLVSLARESFEREGRILDAQLRSGGKQDISPQLIEDSRKAERALELKRIIEDENNKIYGLLHPQEITGESNERKEGVSQ